MLAASLEAVAEFVGTAAATAPAPKVAAAVVVDNLGGLPARSSWVGSTSDFVSADAPGGASAETGSFSIVSSS